MFFALLVIDIAKKIEGTSNNPFMPRMAAGIARMVEAKPVRMLPNGSIPAKLVVKRPIERPMYS